MLGIRAFSATLRTATPARRGTPPSDLTAWSLPADQARLPPRRRRPAPLKRTLHPDGLCSVMDEAEGRAVDALVAPWRARLRRAGRAPPRQLGGHAPSWG
ncbi:MAG: hypothetical protein KC547_09350 [Anaerolineae bacterium]|nr:hypothetical protein [Anaerolineae bacterium]